MRKYFLYLLLLLVTSFRLQAQYIDSLKKSLINHTQDTIRIKTLLYLSNAYLDFERDSAMQYAQDALNLSVQNNAKRLEAASLNIIGSILEKTGNYPKAVEFHLEALKIAEKYNYELLYYSTNNNLGRVSTERSDYKTAIEYYFKAKAGFEKLEKHNFLITTLLNIGDTYDRMSLPDSAFYFLNQARLMAVKYNDLYNLGVITANLGHVSISNDKISEAQKYFREALGIMEKEVDNNDQETLAGAYEGMSRIHESKKNSDSALFYAKKSFAISMKIADQKRILIAAKRLNQLYENENTIDSAYRYSSIANETREKILNEQKIVQLESLKFNEEIRQKEIAKAEAITRKERKNNLQLIAIALFIITFFSILIILSRRKAHPKALRYLGLLGLLLFFEFMTLFIHPFIDKLTGHDPVYMLIILVAVAGILVPIHHKLEHWVKERLAKGLAKGAQKSKPDLDSK